MEFPDGQVKEYAANIIAENMLTQVDSDGMSTTLMEAIVDHQRDDEKALQHHDKYVQSKNRRSQLRKTVKGWELLIKWKNKSESWIKLADMKESHPVEVAEYARARAIDMESAFEWWVPHTLKKRQVILSALKKRIRKTTHKYGIEIATSVEHAFELDRKNGNNLWKDALKMEMYNIGVAFEILEDGKTAPAGYTKEVSSLARPKACVGCFAAVCRSTKRCSDVNMLCSFTGCSVVGQPDCSNIVYMHSNRQFHFNIHGLQ